MERGFEGPRKVRAPPQGLELEKSEESKIKGGGICAPRAQHGRVPTILFIPPLSKNPQCKYGSAKNARRRARDEF